MGNYSKNQALERLEQSSPSEEKRRMERLQAFYYPPIEKTTTNYSIDPSFQIKKAADTSIEKSKAITEENNIFSAKPSSESFLPKLESKPKEPYITRKNIALGYEIAEAIDRNEKILQDITETLMRNISYQNQAILKLSKEDEEHLNELLKQLAKKENVDTIKSLLNVTVASTAIVVGTLLLPEALTAAGATGAAYTTAYGIVLIGSGITNLLANEILPRINGYETIASYFKKDETEKQDLADNIQTASSITSSILSVAAALGAGPVISSILGWTQGLEIVNTATNLATATTSFVKHKNDGNYKNLQSEQTKIDGKLRSERFKLDKEYASLQSATDIEGVFNKVSYNIYQTLRKSSEENLN